MFNRIFGGHTRTDSDTQAAAAEGNGAAAADGHKALLETLERILKEREQEATASNKIIEQLSTELESGIRGNRIGHVRQQLLNATATKSCTEKEVAELKQVLEIFSNSRASSEVKASGRLGRAGFTVPPGEGAAASAARPPVPEAFKFKALAANEAFLSLLKGYGYSVSELCNAGYSLHQCRMAGLPPSELKAAGFAILPQLGEREAWPSGEELTSILSAGRREGRGVQELFQSGFTLQELHEAGFSAMDFLKAGYGAELQGAGFKAEDVQACGLASAMQLKECGYNVNEIKNLRGVELAELIQAGFLMEDLQAAGYELEDFRSCNCNAVLMQPLGYSLADMKHAGFQVEELRDTFTLAELKQVGFQAKALTGPGGFSLTELRESGFTSRELRHAGIELADLKASGYNPEELNQGGYTVPELRAAGFTARQLHSWNTIFTIEKLKAGGFTVQELQEGGFTAVQLKQCGFHAQDIQRAGFTLEALKEAGFTLKELKATNAYSAADFHRIGIRASELKHVGFEPADLALAGYFPSELKACLTANELAQAGLSAGGEPDYRGPHEGYLALRILAGYGLVNKDSGIAGDVSDPYVTASLGGAEHRTPTISNDLNPVWSSGNEFKFDVREKDEKLELLVFNSNSFFKDQSLGSLSVDFRSLPADTAADYTWLRRREALLGVARGELEYEVCYIAGASSLADGAPIAHAQQEVTETADDMAAAAEAVPAAPVASNATNPGSGGWLSSWFSASADEKVEPASALPETEAAIAGPQGADDAASSVTAGVQSGTVNLASDGSDGAFDAIDANHDGVVSREELRAAVATGPSHGRYVAADAFTKSLSDALAQGSVYAAKGPRTTARYTAALGTVAYTLAPTAGPVNTHVAARTAQPRASSSVIAYAPAPGVPVAPTWAVSPAVSFVAPPIYVTPAGGGSTSSAARLLSSSVRSVAMPSVPYAATAGQASEHAAMVRAPQVVRRYTAPGSGACSGVASVTSKIAMSGSTSRVTLAPRPAVTTRTAAPEPVASTSAAGPTSVVIMPPSRSVISKTADAQARDAEAQAAAAAAASAADAKGRLAFARDRLAAPAAAEDNEGTATKKAKKKKAKIVEKGGLRACCR